MIFFEVIPVLNPWGFDHNDRKNGNKVDLNRNFPQGFTFGSDDVEAETEVVDDNEEDSEAEASEEKDTEDKPNFHDVIEELKKKSQNKKDNLSYSDNSNNNSFILNNR